MESYCSLCTFKVPQGANNLILCTLDTIHRLFHTHNLIITCLPLRTDDHILEWSSALDTSVIDNGKINNPTFDVVNDVNQDFSLKYSNNKMGINDMINKLSINNARANLLH